ncbi:hypothetical protein PVT67_01050 [Gallaecimonas kandeliae]|uniref:hypothetical protein n=1 Tax=Gallaecimonas kandeliae TaxID=3029055 RepID=UPI002649AC0C|nr:hypothetical protein [Gallaecimonas kandeliae]WKE65876.1 hypothetical protein PVT67_01050 [Gallaecimonas kandeliae]
MKMRTIVAATLLLGTGSAFASGMSCYIDTKAYDQFTPNDCSALVYGATQATAVFRIDNLPSRYYIDWHNPNCAANATTCTAVIRAFRTFQASATLIDLDAGTTTDVSATASFEDGR